MMYIKNARWSDETRTTIDCDITIGDETRPFTASSTDSEQFGREVYQKIVSEMSIGEYVPLKKIKDKDVPIVLSPKKDPEVEVF